MAGSQQAAIYNVALTNISNKIVPQGFIAEQIFPMVMVKESTGLLGSYGNNHLRISTTLTTGKNKYNNIETRNYSTQAYSIDTHGVSDIIDEKSRANVQAPFDAEVDTTDELTMALMLAKEKGIADSLTSTANLTNNVTLSGTSQLSDYTNSDPIGVFTTARQALFGRVGIKADTVIMPYGVFDKVRSHPKMLELFKYVSGGFLSMEQLASALDVKRILIAEAIYNSAKEGQADSIAPIWGKSIVFCVSPTIASKRQISLGYRFQQLSASRRVFKSMVDDPVNAVKILVDDSYDMLIANANAGYLIKDAIA